MLTVSLLQYATTAYVAYGALQTVEGSAPTLDSFLQYGVLGLIVLCFLTGWIVPGPTAKQMLGENTRLQALVEKVIPVTATYASTMEKATAALDRAASVIESMAQRQADLERRVAGVESREEHR